MAKLSTAETSMLKSLMKEPGWDILLRFMQDSVTEINAEKITGTDAFETLRMLHRNEGKVEGIEDLFEKLEQGTFSN